MAKLNWIMLIDDDETNNFITEIVLNEMEVCKRIEIFTNALKAKEFFEKTDNNYPDLTLLDINLPLLNGFEFLDWYEQSGYKGTTKFIILTTSIRRKDKAAAKKYTDVIGYIEKPLSRHNLSGFLHRLTFMLTCPAVSTINTLL